MVGVRRWIIREGERQMDSLSSDPKGNRVGIMWAGGWSKNLWFPGAPMTPGQKNHSKPTTRELVVVGGSTGHQGLGKDCG